MFYMKAKRDYNGKLQIETLAGLTVDESEFLDERVFLKECATLMHEDNAIYGVVSCDVQSVLVSVY